MAVPSRHDSPAAARAAIAELEGQVEHSLLARVRLLVTELVANSVRHAAGGSVRVTVEASTSCVRGQVVDSGPGFVPEPPNPNPMKTTGWGLFLVHRLADRWGALENESGVWFEIERPRGDARPAAVTSAPRASRSARR